jgi:hypothetical protein
VQDSAGQCRTIQESQDSSEYAEQSRTSQDSAGQAEQSSEQGNEHMIMIKFLPVTFKGTLSIVFLGQSANGDEMNALYD